jgi:transposase
MDEPPAFPEIDPSAHKTARKSARSGRTEIMTRGERRRVRTPEQKREIVAESFGSRLTPSQVARQRAISTGQLYSWRRELLRLQTALLSPSSAGFAEVEVAEPPRSSGGPPAAAEIRPGDLIEIVLPGGVIVRIGPQVSAPALRCVLAELDRR